MSTQRLTPRQLLLVVLYLAVVFLFLEGGARLLVRSDAFVQRIRANDDASWRLAWLARHRDTLETPIFYAFDRWHPTRGWVLAPDLRDVHAMPVRREKTLSSNSLGIRGSVEIPYARTPGRRRVVVLGDSFTFGEDVSDDETYCARLARAMPDTDVINMGVHGYGYDQMLIALEEEGVRYKPDTVVIGFVHADMDRVVLSFRDFAKPRFVIGGDDVVLTHSPVPTPEEVRQAWHSTLADLVDILGARLQREAREREAQVITTALLGRMLRAIRKMGAEPVLAYLPTGRELVDGARGEALLTEIGARGDARVVLLSPCFAEARREGVVIDWQGHYGPLEHDVVARGLLPVLSR